MTSRCASLLQVNTGVTDETMEVAVTVTIPSNIGMKHLEIVIIPIDISVPVTVQGLIIRLCAKPTGV